MMCPPCLVGLHEECYEIIIIEDSLLTDCCCQVESNVLTTMETATRLIGGQKATEDVTDIISTGRKRAAQLKPIIEGMICEWATLLYAGGGVVPIVGCLGTVLTKEKGKGVNTGNIHHGPDKSTLNNSDPNLHRICGVCHNRWHALNNPFYAVDRPSDPEEAFIPISGTSLIHDRHTVASADDLEYSELWWDINPKERKLIPYREVDEDA